MFDLIQEIQPQITFIGLTLNVIGSILFIIDANRLFGWLTYITGQMAKGHGKFDSEKFSQEEMKKFDKRVRNSRTLTLWGFSLFLIGFLTQIIPSIII